MAPWGPPGECVIFVVEILRNIFAKTAGLTFPVLFCFSVFSVRWWEFWRISALGFSTGNVRGWTVNRGIPPLGGIQKVAYNPRIIAYDLIKTLQTIKHDRQVRVLGKPALFVGAFFKALRNRKSTQD